MTSTILYTTSVDWIVEELGSWSKDTTLKDKDTDRTEISIVSMSIETILLPLNQLHLQSIELTATTITISPSSPSRLVYAHEPIGTFALCVAEKASAHLDSPCASGRQAIHSGQESRAALRIWRS